MPDGSLKLLAQAHESPGIPSARDLRIPCGLDEVESRQTRESSRDLALVADTCTQRDLLVAESGLSGDDPEHRDRAEAQTPSATGEQVQRHTAPAAQLGGRWRRRVA
jgi:hypothetical protein